jgi:CDP-diacylglycerol--glycerol-3-phosphate 3-phosphatidyltransferase
MDEGTRGTTFLTRAVGWNIASFRDRVAKGIGKLGVHPNTITVLGLFITILAGVFLAMGGGDSLGPAYREGQSYWRLVAFVLLLLAAAMDMLDGAMARLMGRSTKFGAFLDSCLDRYSDIAVFMGIAVYFVRHQNVTFTALTIFGMGNALLISYAKARGENMVESLGIGYWQRPERWVGLLVATLSGHMRMFAVISAFSFLLTVIRRIKRTHELLACEKSGKTPPTVDPRKRGDWRKLCIWSYPRVSLGYDITSVLTIALIFFVDIPAVDPIGRLFDIVGR